MTLIQTPLETLCYDSATTVNSPAAETAILTTEVLNAAPAVSMNQPNITRPVIFTITLNVTVGTSATALVVNVRQGVGVGGTLVGSRTISVTAGNAVQVTVVIDDPTVFASQPGGSAYTVTVAETGATVAGTVNTIKVEARQ